MKTLLTIGETMACLVPDADGPLRYVDRYRMTMGGKQSCHRCRQAGDTDAVVQPPGTG